MILKWMRCTVEAADRAAFHEAQQAWRTLAGLPGFRIQVGGWNSQNPAEACILGVWADQAAYESFMQHHHDRIADTSGQATTYRAITVTFLDVLGQTGEPAALAGAACLHIAHSVLYPGRETHFREAQRTVWLPGMQGAGMVAGLFGMAQSAEGAPVYLTVSAWPTAAHFHDYLADHFTPLRQQAHLETDTASRTATLICLEPLWTVTPNT
ncbi:MAG: YdbC family protein [Anaerolineaceae bacterium]|nr:YdbC family protein [Anaerolineaceae bacterium]